MENPTLFFTILSLYLFHSFTGIESTSLTITNNCHDAIWPVVSPPLDDESLSSSGGFSLSSGGSRTLTLTQNWSGIVWARTRCATTASGDFLCSTGDPVSGKPSPPATLAEFGPGGSYSLSLVNGYNIAILIVPSSGGSCSTCGCSIDYSTATTYFPTELFRVGDGNNESSSVPVGIKSACSDSCTASNSYSEVYKKLCPQARSYASDDVGTVFSCPYSDFTVYFCGRATSSGGGTVNPRSTPSNGNGNNNYSSLFGKKNVDSKFAIVIGVAVGILGTVLIFVVWRCCRKKSCQTKFKCCSFFTCDCCPSDSDSDSSSSDDSHHHHHGKC